MRGVRESWMLDDGQGGNAALSVVRIHSPSGEVVGAGFVVAPTLVATCAHVVAKALGGDPASDTAPTDPVQVAFPEQGQTSRSEATVAKWVAQRADGSGDIALLGLREPAPAAATTPPLLRQDTVDGRELRMLGFPPDATDGEWLTGKALAGEPTRRWRLCDAGQEPLPGTGFSGTPVWDVAAQAVIGMAAITGAEETSASLIPIQDVLAVDPTFLPNPYRGLRPFGEKQAGSFYGRDTDIERVLRTLGETPIVAVTGRAGIGKSSLIHAGVLPRLRAEGDLVEVANLAGGVRVRELAVDLRSRITPTGLVFVADQFEDLAALHPAEARELLELLHSLIESYTVDGRPRLRVLLTLRWEAMNDLLSEQLSDVLNAGTVPLGPMGRAQLREAILGPTSRAPGLSFEDGLVDRIIGDAQEAPGQLSLLQSLLSQLCERRDGAMLRASAYTELGGVRQALAMHAERVWQRLAAHGEQWAARRLLTWLSSPAADGTGFVAVPSTVDELPGDLRRIAHVLASHRLVVLNSEGTGSVELAHQALIEHWPRLRGWLHDGDYAEPAKRREVERWQLIATVLVVVVLVIGAIAVVVVRSNSTLDASLSSANAKSLAEKALARMPQSPDMGAQLALAAYRADPDSPAARTALGRAYLAALSAGRVFSGVSDTAVRGIDAAPRGAAVLLASRGGYAVLSGVDGPRPRTWQLPGLSGESKPALSPYGGYVLAVQDNRLLSWDVQRRTGPKTLTTLDSSTQGSIQPRFSSDGRVVAWWGPETGLRLWDLVANKEVRHRVDTQAGVEVTEAWPGNGPSNVVLRYGADPDGPDSRVVVRDVATGERTRLLPAADAIAANGTLSVHCEPGQQPSDENNFTETNAVITVSRLTDGKQVSQLPTASYQACENGKFWLSQDRAYLLRTMPSPQRQNTLIRLYSLADGSQYEIAVPPQPHGVPYPASGLWRIYPSFAVLHRPSSPLPVLGQGTALYRYDGPLLRTPRSRGQTLLAPTVDGRYYLTERIQSSTSDGAGFAAVDSSTGRRVAALRALPMRGTSWRRVVDDTFLLSVQHPRKGNLVAFRYVMPSLRRLGTYALPAPAGKGTNGIAEVTPDFDIVGDRLFALSGAVLSTWDLETGERASEPVRLATDPRDIEWLQNQVAGDPSFVSRPRYETQIAVVTRTGALELWNVDTGRRIARLPTGIYTGPDGSFTDQFAIDPTGQYAAFRNTEGKIGVWDLEAREPARKPLSIDRPHELLGFSRTGELVVSTDQGSRYSLVDIHDGQRIGPFAPDGPSSVTEGIMRGRDWLVTGSESLMSFPLDARYWAAQLCAVQNRPYTNAEREALPPGFDSTPPCQ